MVQPQLGVDKRRAMIKPIPRHPILLPPPPLPLQHLQQLLPRHQTTTLQILYQKGLLGVEGLDPASFQNKVVDRILGCIYGIQSFSLLLLSLVLFPPSRPSSPLPSFHYVSRDFFVLIIQRKRAWRCCRTRYALHPSSKILSLCPHSNLLIFTKQRPSL